MSTDGPLDRLLPAPDRQHLCWGGVGVGRRAKAGEALVSIFTPELIPEGTHRRASCTTSSGKDHHPTYPRGLPDVSLPETWRSGCHGCHSTCVETFLLRAEVEADLPPVYRSVCLPASTREMRVTQVSSCCQAESPREPQSNGGPRRCNFCQAHCMISPITGISELERALWSGRLPCSPSPHLTEEAN